MSEDERLDYATLDRRAVRLARALAARGVRPGQIVGLHAGRSTRYVVGVLGILKAGAAYLPLDPAQPWRRLAAMVRDAAPALVLTDVPAADRPADGGDAPAADRPVDWCDLAAVEAEAEVEADGDTPPQVAPDAARLAYVIYTSGSTGLPRASP